MSDTSTLIAIKYKGQMIGLPKDSSVSWNDLEDKPTTSSVFTLQQVTNETEANNLTQLYKSTDGETVSNFAFFKKNSNKELEVYFGPDLVGGSEFKNDYWDYAYYYSGDNLVKLTDKELDYVVIKGVYSPYIMVAGIVLDYTNEDNSYMDYFYSNVLPTPTLSVTTINQKYSPNGKILFRLQWDNSYISKFNFTACRPILNEEYTFLPQYINAYTKTEADNKFALDTSVSELWNTSTGPDLSDYYTKAQIDTSIANNYASKNDISAFITSNDVSIYLTDNDISTFITANDISTFITDNDVSIYLTANDVSIYLTDNDVSIYLTDNDISTFITVNDISTKLEANDVSQFASKSAVSALDTSVSALWDTSTSGGSVDTSNFVTRTELFDEETTTTEPDYAKGDRMFVGKSGHESYRQSFQSDPQTSKAYILFVNLTEQEDIWSYSYYGDYCYMEITNGNNNSVYGWFVLYKDGSVVKASENLSADKISLEYRTSGWPSGLLIFADDSTLNTNPYAYIVTFYQCIYTPGETTTTYTIKQSLLPESSGSGSGISLQYLTQAEYDALQTKDPNTLYLIEESV